MRSRKVSYHINIVFKNIKKIVTPFTATATTTTGAVYDGSDSTTKSFVASDKGCIPILASGALETAGTDGQTQSTSAQLLLGGQAASSATSLLQDMFALRDNVCLVNGVCCYTNLCNNSFKLASNAIVLGIAVIPSLMFAY